MLRILFELSEKPGRIYWKITGKKYPVPISRWIITRIAP